MAEDKPTGTPSDDGKPAPGQGEPKKTTSDDVISRVEFQRVVAQRDELKSSLRSLEEKVNSIESAKGEAELQKARKEKDIETIEATWQGKYDGLNLQLESLQTERTQSVVKDKFRSIADGKVFSTEQVLQIVGPNLSTKKNEAGEDVLIVKDGEITRHDVDRWLSEFLDKNPNLAANNRKRGVGDTGGPQGGQVDGATQVPIDFNTWPAERRHEWITKNRDLALQSAEAGLRAGIQP